MSCLRHRAWRLALVLTAELLIAACGHEQDNGGGSFPPPPPPRPSATAATTEPSPPVDPSSCPVDHPLPLPWAPESDEEAVAQKGLVACANPAQTDIWLSNASDAVWVVTQPAGLSWQDEAIVPLDVETFRRTVTPGGGLPVEPGITATIASRPEALRVILTERASASWATVRWFKQAANDKA